MKIVKTYLLFLLEKPKKWQEFLISLDLISIDNFIIDNKLIFIHSDKPYKKLYSLITTEATDFGKFLVLDVSSISKEDIDCTFCNSEYREFISKNFSVLTNNEKNLNTVLDKMSEFGISILNKQERELLKSMSKKTK